VWEKNALSGCTVMHGMFTLWCMGCRRLHAEASDGASAYIIYTGAGDSRTFIVPQRRGTEHIWSIFLADLHMML